MWSPHDDTLVRTRKQGALELAPDVEAALREAATLAETLDVERSLGRHQRALIIQHEKEVQMLRQVHDHPQRVKGESTC